MSTGVLLALTGPVESELVRLLHAPGSDLRVVRRCADVPEVLAAAGAGLGTVAVLGAEFPGLDRSVVARLRSAGTRTLLVAAPEDATRASALGPDAVEPAGSAAALAEAVRAVVRTPEPGEAPPPPPPSPEPAPGTVGPPENREEPGAGVTGTGASGVDPGGRQASASTEDAETPGTPAGTTAATGSGARRGSLVVVWGPPGAPGRTTTAVTLATELATLSGRSLLVDADTEAPSVTQMLGILDDASAIAAVSRQALAGRLDAGALLRSCPALDSSVHVMTGLTRADRWREVPAAALELVWDVAREAVPWTVVDVGPTLEGDDAGFGPGRHEATMSALNAADVLVVVGAGDPIGMRRLVMALADLADGDVAPSARRVVVVGRVRSSAAGPSPGQAVHEALARFAGVTDPVVVPDDRPAFDKAVMQGTTLDQVAPNSPARDALVHLAHRLTGERHRPRRRRLWPARR